MLGSRTCSGVMAMRGVGRTRRRRVERAEGSKAPLIEDPMGICRHHYQGPSVARPVPVLVAFPCSDSPKEERQQNHGDTWHQTVGRFDSMASWQPGFERCLNTHLTTALQLPAARLHNAKRELVVAAAVAAAMGEIGKVSATPVEDPKSEDALTGMPRSMILTREC